MATLNLKGIAQLVSDQAAAIQSKASPLVDFTKGSILRAVVEATAAVAVWLQGLILQVLALTRLASSFGVDVDSFIQDFGLVRLSGSFSAGQAIFSRYTAASATVIPVGTKVQTQGGTQQYQVIADSTNGAYSAGANGYLLPAGVPSVSVTLQALVAGAAGNAGIGTVNVLTTAISGVDSVTNIAALSGGTNVETDGAVKVRFVLFILGLQKGTIYGTQSAIANLIIGVQQTITENYTLGGAFQPGFYYIVVDDGTGYPTPAFLISAANAANAVRPLTGQMAVFPPTVILADVSMIIATGPGYNHATVTGQVGALITANIKALGLGVGLPFSELSAWAYSVLGVTNVTSVLLNSASGDGASIAANKNNTIKPRSISVS